jgi:hypothetical protein
MIRNEEPSRGYSYVGKRVGDEVRSGVVEICPNCKSRALIKDVNKWRNTGAGLICDVCAGTKSGRIAANDNYEILKVKSNNEVVLPERFKQERK